MSDVRYPPWLQKFKDSGLLKKIEISITILGFAVVWWMIDGIGRDLDVAKESLSNAEETTGGVFNSIENEVDKTKKILDKMDKKLDAIGGSYDRSGETLDGISADMNEIKKALGIVEDDSILKDEENKDVK